MVWEFCPPLFTVAASALRSKTFETKEKMLACAARGTRARASAATMTGTSLTKKLFVARRLRPFSSPGSSKVGFIGRNYAVIWLFQEKMAQQSHGIAFIATTFPLYRARK